MNRRQFLITSIVAGVAAIAAPVLKHVPLTAGGMLEPYDLARWYQMMLERNLYKVHTFQGSPPHFYCSISEVINAR